MSSIVVYTDQPILASGIKSLMAGDPLFTLAGCCMQVQALREFLCRTNPDLALLDLTPEVTRTRLEDIHRLAPQTKLILWADGLSADFALQSITLGVRGVLRKTLSLNGYLQCLQRVDAGGLWFEKSLTDRLGAARRVSLSPRESQLVVLLSRGLKNKEISHELGITEGTVKVYLSHLFQKSGAKDRFDLAVHGIKNLRTPGMLGDGPRLDTLVMEPLCGA